MWTAHLYQSTTGIIGARLNYESITWSMALNDIESIELRLRKSELPALDLRYWLNTWWAGVVLLWDGKPVVAGPIISRPWESPDTISISCGGIRSILANRVVVQEQTNWGNLARSQLHYSGLSLGTIAKRVVAASQQKAGGSLPISYPIADELGPGGATHERTYRGFDLQNLTCDEVLKKLSDTTDGPDIMFKPRLLRDNQLTFDMWHGTNANPRISQKNTMIWDTVPEQGQISNITTNYTGTYQASRIYSTGAGMDEGLLIAVSTNSSPLQKGFPLLEKVISISNSEDPNVVRTHGESNLAVNTEPLLEVQMTVRADGPVPIGNFWPGDLAHVYLKGWVSIPDGLTAMRILSISGDESNDVRISLQKEDRFIQ